MRLFRRFLCRLGFHGARRRTPGVIVICHHCHSFFSVE
jgi:hypothetical protein